MSLSRSFQANKTLKGLKETNIKLFVVCRKLADRKDLERDMAETPKAGNGLQLHPRSKCDNDVLSINITKSNTQHNQNAAIAPVCFTF